MALSSSPVSSSPPTANRPDAPTTDPPPPPPRPPASCLALPEGYSGIQLSNDSAINNIQVSVDEMVRRIDSTIPRCTHFLDPTLPSPELEAQVRHICRTLLEKWSHLADDRFTVSPVSGGITNLLLKVSVRDDSGEEPVTVRVFGPNANAVIDRKRELQAIPSLSGAGFGAKLLGVFKNGMVQTFINAQTLTPSDIRRPELATHIAREVQKLHGLNVPGSKEPQLWADIYKFLDKASVLTFEDNTKQSRYATISFNELRAEVDAVKEASDNLKAPIVFAHNDLLSGNFMFDEQKGELYIIDFEYGSYNYRGYDIANHLAEYAGFDCDHSVYTSKDAQYHFFRHYLCPTDPQEVSQIELEELYVETTIYSLAAHLFWSVWAIVQAKYSSIDFDYFDYYFRRYNEYKRRKTESLSLVATYLAKSTSGLMELDPPPMRLDLDFSSPRASLQQETVMSDEAMDQDDLFEDAACPGSVVLLLHGFPEFWYSWRHQIPVIAEAGYHVVAPDLRGYGKTDAPLGAEKYTALHIVGDLIGLLDALSEQQAFIIGHDWGAICAWHFCLLRPDRVRALIALSVPYVQRTPAGSLLKMWGSTLGDGFYMHRFQEPGRAEEDFGRYDCKTIMRKILPFTISGPLIAPPDKEISEIFEEPQTLPPWISEEEIEQYANQFERTGFTGALNYYRALDLTWELLAPWTGASVVVPALFMIGDRDTVYSTPGTKDYIHNGGLKAGVPNLKDIIVLEGVHHFFHEESPEVVNSHILNFLKSYSS